MTGWAHSDGSDSRPGVAVAERRPSPFPNAGRGGVNAWVAELYL